MAKIKNSNPSPRGFNSYRRHNPTPKYNFDVTMYKYLVKDSNGVVNVPAGPYPAAIDKIKSTQSHAGNDAWNVFFTLHAKSGKTYYVQQCIVKYGDFLENFLDFLEKAGVDMDNIDPEDFSGDVGTVYVVYPDDNRFGHITYSKPYVSNHKPKKASSMDGLLSEDDEDEVEADENDPELDELDEEDVEEYLEEEE